MAKSRPSVQKRINEARKLEKAQEKAARKAARMAARAARIEGDEEGAVDVDVDPDLADIVPGPQPVRHDPLSRFDPE